MLGGKIKQPGAGGNKVTVRYTAEVVAGDAGAVSSANLINPSTKNVFNEKDLAAIDNKFRFINMTQGYRGSATHTSSTNVFTLTANDGNSAAAKGDRIRLFWDVVKTGAENEGNTAVEITISPNTFPGTYKIVGDTFMRNTNGKDYPFQFVINRAKNLVA